MAATVVIPAEGRPPQPPYQNLLASIDPPIDAGPRWSTPGAQLEWLQHTGSATMFDPCDASFSVDDVRPTLRMACQVGLMTEFTCSTFQHAGLDYERRAAEQLDAWAPATAEAMLWSGAGIDPDCAPLNGPDTPIVGGGPLSPALAWEAVLDSLSGTWGGQLTLHAKPSVVAALDAGILNWLVPEGRRLYTRIGHHLVVPGVGYDGSGPDDVGGSWLYFTGNVYVWQSSDQVIPVNESVDRLHNTISVRAVRLMAVGFEDAPAFGAVELDIGTGS